MMCQFGQSRPSVLLPAQFPIMAAIAGLVYNVGRILYFQVRLTCATRSMSLLLGTHIAFMRVGRWFKRATRRSHVGLSKGWTVIPNIRVATHRPTSAC